MNYAFIKCLDAILLLYADTWLGFDDCPKLQDIVLDFLDVDNWGGTGVGAGHLLDICFQLTNVLTNHFGINDISLSGDFSVGRGGKSD
jgi:hypothetical protein